MNFLLNVIVCAVSLVVVGIFGLIILAAVLVLRAIGYRADAEVEKMEQPVPVNAITPQDDSMAVEVVKITKLIHAIDGEDQGWQALRSINRLVAEYADH